MPVISVDKAADTLTMTVVSEFDASVERVWQLWEDPRQLEQWWGPPTHPATFVDHDLSPGGRMSYFMTGPEGDKYHGWWEVLTVDAPTRLELEDGFADDAGRPDPDMPTSRTTVELTERAGGGTQMTLRTRFPSPEAMEQLTSMGMDEGLREAINQIDDLLAGATSR